MDLTETVIFREVFAGPAARRPPDLGRWRRMETGGGELVPTDTGLRLTTANTAARSYTNAQIDDYQGRARRDFPWRPPLALTVRARFSHRAARAAGDGGLRGTAGFGFWNDPFMMTGSRAPAPPRAIWFFYASPPSDIALDSRITGFGWKAATIDALRPGAAVLALQTGAPILPLGFYVPPESTKTIIRHIFDRTTVGRWQWGGRMYLSIGEPWLPAMRENFDRQYNNVREVTDGMMSQVSQLVAQARAMAK